MHRTDVWRRCCRSAVEIHAQVLSQYVRTQESSESAAQRAMPGREISCTPAIHKRFVQRNSAVYSDIAVFL